MRRREALYHVVDVRDMGVFALLCRNNLSRNCVQRLFHAVLHPASVLCSQLSFACLHYPRHTPQVS